MLRDAVSFLPVRPDEASPGEAIRTFNAGVMLIGGDLLVGGIREALFTVLEDTDWPRVRSGHTDQYVLNRVFRDRWRPLPERYNRLVTPQGLKRGAEDAISDAVFLHFVGRPKPWMGRMGPDWRRSEGARRYALREWDRARLRWALARARRGDAAPLLEVFRREAIRFGGRILRKAPPQRPGRERTHYETATKGGLPHG